MGEKEHNHQDKNRSEGGGERCLRTAFFIDERLRCAAAHWQATTESSEQVRRGECQIFLVSIKSSAVLRSAHSSNRGRFDDAEKKASQGQWKQLVQVTPVKRRKFQRRYSLGHDAN